MIFYHWQEIVNFIKGIDNGFTSVMYDGSKKPLKEIK